MITPTITPPNLDTPRLTLRRFVVADAARVQQLAGDARVAHKTASVPHPYPAGAAEAWIATHDASWEKEGVAAWAVCLRAADDQGHAAGTLVGCISLIGNRTHNRADLGYWLGVEFWNRGYCTEAARRLIDFGFDVLKLGRIGATHLPENPASGRVMRKLGMNREGTQRQVVLLRGERRDLVHYGMLPGDPR